MNRFAKYITIGLVFAAQITYAQNFSGWGGAYVQVGSYLGENSTQPYVLDITGTGPVNVSDWRLTVRVTSVGKDGNGNSFPLDKLLLTPSTSLITACPSNASTVSQVGFVPNMLLAFSEQDLVMRPPGVKIYNQDGCNGGLNTFYRYQFGINWAVLGGAYLGQLIAWYKYDINVEFKLYANGILKNTIPIRTQVELKDPLTGSPPVQNSFSLTVGAGAQNGILTLQSRSDYENGKSVTYNNGLTVKTNANYQVTVNASPGTPYFSYQNNNIDLDVLNVQLATTASGVTNLNPVTLSTGAQVIAKGSSTNNNNQNFNVTYSVNPAQKDKLFYAFKDKQQGETTYTTTLQYTILAQ
ncbi:MAG: hypothetical protein KF870_03860 [Leadbetterella sp.]|nr:hypothetical protein [Leadbetterella sp.]